MRARWAILICVALPVSSSDARSVKVYMNSGTGFIVSRDGHVITNDHVVKGCRQITVDGAVRPYNANVVGSSHTLDLALLQMDGGSSEAANLRSGSQPLEKGESVVIVGYPGNAKNPVTKEAKILNPKGPRGEEQWVEMDDVIQQGNSGGAVLDSAGNVVGVVAAKATIYTYPVDDPRAGTTRNSGIAISLPVLKEFLDRYRVRYREAESHNEYSSHRVTDIAERIMVHVRCAYKTEVQ
ncbi:MAG: S1C family serine protease [Alphaproteobacteria bacterium]